MSRDFHDAQRADAGGTIDTDAKQLVRPMALFLYLGKPRHLQAAADEPLRRFVHGAKVDACAAAADHHVEEAGQFVTLVGVGLELGVGEERVEDTEVSVAEGGGGYGEVEEVADHDIDEDAEVVGVEVFVGGGCGEEEVEDFEDEEL